MLEFNPQVRQQPAPTNEPSVTTQAIGVLNRALKPTREYISVIDKWPDKTPIWPYLESMQAREVFARHILSSQPREKGVAGHTGLETGTLGDRPAQYLFVCRHFARKRAFEVGMQDRVPPVDSEYPFVRLPSKMRLPIFEVIQARSGHNPDHVQNAVFLGEGSPGRDSTEWLIVEPQGNTVIYSPTRGVPLLSRFSNNSLAWAVIPADHEIPLDRACKSPYHLAGIDPRFSYSQFSYLLLNCYRELRAMPPPILDFVASRNPIGAIAAASAGRFEQVAELIQGQQFDTSRDDIIAIASASGNFAHHTIKRMREYAAEAPRPARLDFSNGVEHHTITPEDK